VDPAFLARTVKEARRKAHAIEADPKALDAELGKVSKQLSNLLNLGAESGDKAGPGFCFPNLVEDPQSYASRKRLGQSGRH
jgi:hypothetical protein